jgi:hypothetical protein
MPDGNSPPGIYFWRRPTLARPIAVLPSGLQRFTSVFGMGTGGTTALGSPECGTAPAVSLAAVAATQVRSRISGDDIELSKNASFSGIYIQAFISAEDSRRYNFI